MNPKFTRLYLRDFNINVYLIEYAKSIENATSMLILLQSN